MLHCVKPVQEALGGHPSTKGIHQGDSGVGVTPCKLVADGSQRQVQPAEVVSERGGMTGPSGSADSAGISSGADCVAVADGAGVPDVPDVSDVHDVFDVHDVSDVSDVFDVPDVPVGPRSAGASGWRAGASPRGSGGHAGHRRKARVSPGQWLGSRG